MFVCCECCVLPGRALCDELITRPERSPTDVVCDLENLKNEETMTRIGSQRHRKKNRRIALKIHWANVQLCFVGVRQYTYFL